MSWQSYWPRRRGRLAPDEAQVPHTSSPVCYAHLPGLREGFEDAGLPGPVARQVGLREALEAARHAVSLMLGSAPAGAIPEKQIAALVYQLYELSPEEIAAFERP